MSVELTDLSKRYNCNGSNQAFPITFDYLDTEALVQVLLYSTSLGTYSELTLDTDYTITDDTVTTVSTYPTGYDILLKLDFTDLITQGTDWVENDKFTSGSWETAVDRLTLICQWLAEGLSRCIQGPFGDADSITWTLGEAAPDRLNGYLHFNATTGNIEIVSSVTPSTATVSAFGETIIDDTSASAVLSTLSMATYVNAELRDADTYSVSNADYAILDADGYRFINVFTGASTRTITLPTRSDNDGRRIVIRKTDLGVGYVAVVPDTSSDTINGTSLWDITERYGFVDLEDTGSEWGVVSQQGSVYRDTVISVYTITHSLATWGAVSALTLAIPAAGVYDIRYEALILYGPTGSGYVILKTAISENNDSVSDKQFVDVHGAYVASNAGYYYHKGQGTGSDTLPNIGGLPTTYRLIVNAVTEGTISSLTMALDGANQTSVIEAIRKY